MVLRCPPKPDLETFITTCTPLYSLPPLEEEIQARVEAIRDSILRHQPLDNSPESLATFLQAEPDFLGVILGFANLSQEKFLRLLSAERFAQGDFAPEWGINRVQQKLAKEPLFALKVAHLLVEGQRNAFLVAQIAPFYLKQLALPHNWTDLLQDRMLMDNIIRRKLTGEYTDKKGEAIENLVRSYLDALAQTYGFSYAKGQVKWVGKEVDHALPDLENPDVLIMTSYLETTSSNQTTRANEQSEMYRQLEQYNIRYGTQKVLVNVLDGAGWLARRSDLRKMLHGCHYALSLKTLGALEAIICKHLSAKFFTKKARPNVED
jgi:hypothetical protein